MAIEGVNVGQELLNVPMGEMIRSMAFAIADAQWELDKASMTVAEMMSGQRLLRDIDTGKLLDFEGRPLDVDIRADGVPVKKVERKDKKPEEIETAINTSPVVTPCVVDSRVYFGYTYEPVREAGKIVLVDNPNDKKLPKVPQMVRVPNKVSMMELGFTPTFYQFVDTIIEVKIAIKMTRDTTHTVTSRQQEEETTKKDVTVAETTTQTRHSGWYGWWRGGSYSSSSSTETKHKKVGDQTTVRATSVDAAYSSKFSFSVEGSSLLRTKLVPVPPPAILEDRIRQIMERETDYQEQVKQGLMVPKSAPSS